MTSIDRVYAGRLSGMIVRNPDGDAIGRARDVVVRLRPSGAPSRALGLVLQLTDKRRVFVPMGRITAIEPNEILLNSGLVSMRQFRARPGESTVLGDLVGAKVQIDDPDLEHLHGVPQELTDVEMERSRTRDWILTRVAVLGPKRGLRGRRDVAVAPWNHVHGLGAGAEPSDHDTELIAEFHEMRPADVASAMADMSNERRRRIAEALDDELLADIIQELPDDDQTEVLEDLTIERAADILEEMDPDDAADLLGELDENRADVLLELMAPEESQALRRLMVFEPDTVGGLMTSDPLILQPTTTVAEALARARDPELPTSLASMVFVVRPPTATPTGRYLGCVHLQKLLREPPSTQIGGILDPDLPPLYAEDDDEIAARYFATYNLVCGPVIDDEGHLLGALSVDDLLDHMLPDDWREDGIRPAGRIRTAAAANTEASQSNATRTTGTTKKEA
ncbi:MULTISPECIES: magnesium transporter MgtE N-terminal domain-containing protein [Corynebacterium]|uniref:Mg/Co/Ni transporter MgtE n=1 Tax=Corynebacterium freneyi TaxID=134034 RepID=A0ABS4U8K2_9CORY|nr:MULTISPECIES: CBS domain-containing protein [Corynebacterium]MBP2332989.1 Mg/Co/Ni transporter MgtE [Corynebacterium freneyi]MCG7439979.1 CBS domain-containing protein [Corynebacterium freneyi]QXA52905.1 CBS domain-containing protein [Corynebacterium freneyi]UBI03081.1 CBS domain-containing protein [Corynebacterium freneyi]WJZ04909.1 Magnesium transporter MgtE [Corynebacterium freneyi]